jgi:hypothetical protein
MNWMLVWWLSSLKDLSFVEVGVVLMNLIGLNWKSYQLLLSKSFPFRMLFIEKVRSLRRSQLRNRISLLKVLLFLSITVVLYLLQWILDIKVEVSSPIILRHYSGLLQWWFLITDSLHKSLFIPMDIRMHLISH